MLNTKLQLPSKDLLLSRLSNLVSLSKKRRNFKKQPKSNLYKEARQSIDSASSLLSVDRTYIWSMYPELGQEESAKQMCKDIHQYLGKSRKRRTKRPHTFCAVFENYKASDDSNFDDVLWDHLMMAHNYDSTKYPWNPETRSTPNSDGVCFSLGGKAFYVVAGHPKSEREDRKFTEPMVFFNVI